MPSLRRLAGRDGRAAMARRKRFWEIGGPAGLARRVLPWTAGTLVLFLVLSPAVLTHRGFQNDFTNHMWLVGYQGRAWSGQGHPSLFLHGGAKFVFEPFFAFYGGTLYAAAGLLAWVSGNAGFAFVAFIAAGLGASYVGYVWLARRLGVGGAAAHVPAVVFVTSAYYLTDLYARGAWPEFMALSSMPLLVAAAVELLQTRPVRRRTVLAFSVAAVVFTGSHNITLVWGTAFLGLVAVLVVLALPRAERPSPRRLILVAALGCAAIGVNAWFLVYDVLDSRDVRAAGSFHRVDYASLADFQSVEHLFSPLRNVPEAALDSSPGLSVNAPVLALGWALAVGLALMVSRTSRSRSRWWWIAVGTLVLGFGLLRSPTAWQHIGPPFSLIQFVYRLNGYTTQAAAALVLATLVMLQRAATADRRKAPAYLVLAGVVVLSLVQAGVQVWDPGLNRLHFHDRRDARATAAERLPRTWYDELSYADRSRSIVVTAPGRSIVVGQHLHAGSSVLRERVRLPAGLGPVATNIAGGPALVQLDGLVPVGRTATGTVAVQGATGERSTTIAVRRTSGPKGRLAALFSLLSILTVIALTATARRWGPWVACADGLAEGPV